MELLYAPWRGKYVVDAEKNHHSDNWCPFCEQIKSKNDKEALVLKRFDKFYVCLNKYPYNPGHILIIPYEHTDQIEKLDANAWTELGLITNKCNKILKSALNSQGVNFGLNMGKAAGGTVPNHLHFHLVPRWTGDCNFLPAITKENIKPISADLFDVYDNLSKAINNENV